MFIYDNYETVSVTGISVHIKMHETENVLVGEQTGLQTKRNLRHAKRERERERERETYDFNVFYLLYLNCKLHY